MEILNRFFQDTNQSYFLFGPRGTGKSTWVKQHLKTALYIDLLAPEVSTPANSLKRFRGAAAHLRDPQVDAQEYVNNLRSEWDDRR